MMGKKDSQEAKEKKAKRKEKMKKFKKRTLKILMAISIIAVLFGVLLVVLAFTVLRPGNAGGPDPTFTKIIMIVFGAIFIIVGGKLFFKFKETLQDIGRDKSGYSTKPIQTGESKPSFVYDVQDKYRGEMGGNSSVDYYISKVDATVSSVLDKATVTVGIEWSVKYHCQYDYSYMSEVKAKIERDIKAIGRTCGENNVRVYFEETKK
ncbi:MAG: hypothetical protein ACI4MQ_02990 [Candidatus Coproplasma sp.]